MSLSNEFENLNGNLSIEEKEKLESARILDSISFLVNSKPLKILEKKDHLEVCNPERCFNKTSNPIIRSFTSREHGLPLAVYAYIEKHHLGTGQETNTNRKLAEEVRNLGYKDPDGHSLDFCAHIIAPSLGGQMEKSNLIPVGRTDNWDGFVAAERTIFNFINKKQSQNGRAYLRLFIFYDDKRNPSCPTRMEFSYLLFSDDKQGKQQPYSKVFFPVYVPEHGEISIEELTFEAATAETPFDREGQKLIDQVRKANEPNEGVEFWRNQVSTMEIVKSITLGVLVLYLGYTQWWTVVVNKPAV